MLNIVVADIFVIKKLGLSLHNQHSHKIPDLCDRWLRKGSHVTGLQQFYSAKPINSADSLSLTKYQLLRRQQWQQKGPKAFKIPCLIKLYTGEYWETYSPWKTATINLNKSFELQGEYFTNTDSYQHFPEIRAEAVLSNAPNSDQERLGCVFVKQSTDGV